MLNGPGLTTERPVRRDPLSGHLLPHPSYEGWAPRPFDPGWWLVAAGVLAVALARLAHII